MKVNPGKYFEHAKQRKMFLVRPKTTVEMHSWSLVHSELILHFECWITSLRPSFEIIYIKSDCIGRMPITFSEYFRPLITNLAHVPTTTYFCFVFSPNVKFNMATRTDDAVWPTDTLKAINKWKRWSGPLMTS